MNLIFDYDGTCHDTAGIYTKAVLSVIPWLKERGYVPAGRTDNERLCGYLGMTAEDMWSDFLPDAPSDITTCAAQMVGTAMIQAVRARQTRLYEGIPELLYRLRNQGHQLLILSNCDRQYMDAHRQALELDRYFMDYYLSGDFDGIPKERIYETIRKKYAGRFCVIGDRLSDMRVGYLHGGMTVACLYGYGSPKELNGADYAASSVTELTQILLSLPE